MVNNSEYQRAIKSLWNGKCTVTVRKSVTDENTGRVKTVETDIYTDEPCRISFSAVRVTEPTSNAAEVLQSVKLFISPAVSIPPGSKITATQNGITNIYEQSGKSAVYSEHQEIPLELKKEWA